MKVRFKQRFYLGLLWVLPVVVSLYIVYVLINTIGGKLGKVLKFIPPFNYLTLPSLIYNLIGLILTIFIVYILGFMAEMFIGKFILNMVDKIFNQLPFIKVIYNASKDIMNAIMGGNKKVFQKVVLINFPHKDSKCIAFLTSESKININGKKHYGVFIPTTPNPTSGWYILVKEEDIEFTNLKVEEALKIIISAGVTLKKGENKNNVFFHKKISE